jgi:uncharacterized protein YecE (DUF72 family)
VIKTPLMNEKPLTIKGKRSDFLCLFSLIPFHGRPQLYRSFYSESALRDWADRLQPHFRAGRDCYLWEFV